ncbi:rhomboid-like protein [Mycobacterium sp. E740]|uniref:rhomboid-like protein n=1 Tax=Mycobacterium sp. E740 TaxID=1834149 RepID=UPI0008014DE2|nr:rhomboid-like protein [Mycobacterium sp. E740]OBI72232.1 hypothetical protein A5663_08230 [Mycobacterium sp. E740]
MVGWLGRLAQVRVTVAYAVILAAVTSALLWLPPRVKDRAICHASTNLHNLAHGHVGTLVGSAFVVDAGPMYLWLPGLICLLALAELLWGSTRLLVTFAAGHVGATLVVAAVLTAGIEQAWLPDSMARVSDVGVSYGAAAVLGSLTAAIPLRWRAGWIGWWLAIGIAAVAFDQDFTDVGHAVGLTLGMLVSIRFGRAGPWTPVRCLLLAVAVAFGYVLLVTPGWTTVVAMAGGLTAAASGALAVLSDRRSAFEAPSQHPL